MFNKQLLQLIKINLLYVNPEQTHRQRDEQGKTGTALYRSLIRQYLIVGLVFVVIFGLSLMASNLVKEVGAFSNILALFTIMGLAQSVSAIDNVFFESQDLQDYLPLPLSQWAVYLAKFLVIVLTILPTALPIWMMFVVTGIQTGRFIGIGFTVGTGLFLIYYVFLFLLFSILIFALAQTKLYHRHQKMMTFLMTTLTMITTAGAYIVINQTNNTLINGRALPGFAMLHQVVVNPISLASGLTVGFLLVAIGLMSWVMQKALLPRVMGAENHQEKRTVKRTHRGHGMNRQFFRYNLGLLANPTLLTQSFSNTIFPLILYGAVMLMGNGLSLSNLTLKYAGVTFVGGIVMGLMTINQGSLASVMISLERQNLLFIKSLPINFERYLWLKFRLVVVVQALVLTVIAVIFGPLVHLMWVDLVTLIIGLILGDFLGSLYCFTRDWRLLDLSWTNITQLFSRGGGNLVTGLFFLGMLIAGGLIVALYAALVDAYSPALVNAVALLLVLVATVITTHHYVTVLNQIDKA